MELCYLLYSNFLYMWQKKGMRWTYLGFLVIVSAIFFLLMNKTEFRLKQVDLEKSQEGLKIFNQMIFYIVGIVFFVFPWFIIQLDRKESKSKGAELLILTQNPIRLLIVRHTATVIILLFYFLGTLPIFLLCTALGGINGWQIVYSYLLMFSSICFVASLSLALSSESEFLVEAIIFTYMASLFFSFFLAGIFLSPLSLLVMVLEKGYANILHILLTFFVNIIISFIFLWASAKRFVSTILDKIPHLIDHSPLPRSPSKKKHLKDAKNIITWRDQQSKIHRSIYALSTIIVIFLSASIFTFFGNAVIYSIYYVLTAFALIAIVSSFFIYYEEQKSFELLLLTTLSPQNIVKQKFLNIYYHTRWLLVLLSFLVLCLLLSKNKVFLQGRYYLDIIVVVTSVFCVIFFNGFIVLQQKRLGKAFKFIVLFMIFVCLLGSYSIDVVHFYHNSTKKILMTFAYSGFMLCICYFFFCQTVKVLASRN